MKRFYCFTLGFFLLTVQAEKEDFQGYHTEQKSTTVTQDLLLKRENTIGHGTEAIPTEDTHQHAAVAAATKFPELHLFDTRPMPPYERTQIPKASAVIASTSSLIASKGKNSLKSTKDSSLAMRIHAVSETPSISNHDKIVFSSTQAALKSMMNGTMEPEVYLSADAVKASLWLHTLLDNRNQRNTDSITLTSADRGPGVPILSASHPRVIDNPAVLRNDNDDKRSQGKDDKGFSNLGRNGYQFGTMQSIFQSDTAEDSVSGNPLTNLCLTCQEDRRAVSTEKSVALPALSLDDSSDSLSVDALALDFSQFITSLPSLRQQSVGGREEMLNKDISQQNITKQSSFGMKQQLVYNLTFPPLSLNKTVNQRQSIFNNSQIKYYLSDIGTIAFDTQSLPEMSSATQALVARKPLSTTTALYRSSKSVYIERKQEMLDKKVSIGDPQSKPIYRGKDNKNASHSLSTNLKNVFIQKQPLDFSSGSESNSADIARTPHRSQTSVLPEDSDHRAASHPTAGTGLMEVYSAPISLSMPATSAVKHLESHSLTGSADSLISVLRSQTAAKPSCKTKDPILTLFLKNSGIKFTSVTTKRHLTDQQHSETFNTVNSLFKQYFVDPEGPVQEAVGKEPQTPKLTTRKVVVPVKLFHSESRRDLGYDASTPTQTSLSRKSFSERLTISTHLGSQSKITQEKPGDKNEQVITVVAGDEDAETITTEDKQGDEIKETLKLQEDEQSRDDVKLGNEREELHRSDTESGKQEKIMNTDRGEDKMEDHEAKTSREEGGGTIREEVVTLRRDKDPGQGEVRDQEDAEKQRVSLREEGAEVIREEAASIKCNREIGREDMTNAPLGPTTNSKELNRDKGHTMTNLSSCHSLIKQFGAPEYKDIHLGENIAQIVEMKNKPFSYGMTSNHRPLHSTLRSQSPKLSRMTSFPKESHTQIKPHPSTHRAMLTKHRAASSLTKESTQNKAAEVTFSVTAIPKMVPKPSQAFGVSTSKSSDASKPTISLHSSASKTAHPVLKSINNMLSLTTPRVAITAKLLRAQPNLTVNTLSVSIIYSISDHKHKISTLISKENSLLPAMNERERSEHMPAHMFDSSVKDLLTSNMTEEVNTSSALTQHMYNDSSTGPPITAALSSIDQPHQRQTTPQTSQSASSSFDITSGQPFSFKLSEKTAHSDALHAPVDDNKQRSVQTLMPSMSPKAKNDQFPLSSMSPLPTRMLFGDDSLPGTYSLTGLTRSASEKEILRASADAKYANGGSGHAETLLGATDETYQTEENDSGQKTVTWGVKHSHVVMKQMAERKDGKNRPPFIEQAIRRSEHHASSTEKFNCCRKKVEDTNEDNHTDLFGVDGRDVASKTVKNTLEINHLSQLGGYNETSARPYMSAIQTTLETEQAVHRDFVPVTNYLAVPMLDTNDRTGTTVFVDSESQPEMPQIQAKDVTNNAISDVERHAAKTTEKQHDLSTPRGAAADSAAPVPHIHFGTDLKVPNVAAQQIVAQIMNVASEFQITKTKTNDFMSLAPTASASGIIVSTDAHESALTTSESVPVVIEKSSQAAHAERMVQSKSHIEPLSLREPLASAATGKLSPAVKRINTTETQSVEQSEREISVQVIEQNQHAPLGMTTITRPISDPGQSVQGGLLKAAHGAGRADDTTSTMRINVIKTTLTTKSAFEAKHPLHDATQTVHASDRAEQHKKQALPEKTLISLVILGAVTDSVPSRGISPTEISNKSSDRTIGCAKAGETTETTIRAGEIDHRPRDRMHTTRAGTTGGDHFDAVHTPDTKPQNGNCSTDPPVSGKVTPQATSLDYATLSPSTGKSDQDHTTVDEITTKTTNSMTDETLTRARRALVETDHLERRGKPEQFVEKTTQRHSHRQPSIAQEAATEVTLPEPGAITAQTTVKTTERTLLTGKKIKTQLNSVADKVEIFEAQNATRSARAVAKGETAEQESGRRRLLPEPESESELPGPKHRRRTSSHLYLSGVTEVSDDLCGTGNYTAEMSLKLGRGVEPGDAVPALANLRVVINLKTNYSRINLNVTSCCLSPTIQPDLINSTCCLFSRLAAEPAGITLLPSAVSTSASFTISLFQMINYSVVYLHCDLSVCPRNRSDCERQCRQQRSAFPLEGREAVTNLRNRISFGPMLKEVTTSTFPEEIDPSELDLVLVIVSLVVGSSLVTVTLLLVWLAYRRRAIWLLRSAAPPRACCGCLHPGGDLIQP